MAETYSYSIASDTANATFEADALDEAIKASAIVGTINRVKSKGDAISVVFTAALSSGDQAILDGLVSSHDGRPRQQGTQIIIGDKVYEAVSVVADGSEFRLKLKLVR
jgi:hypothetical protein